MKNILIMTLKSIIVSSLISVLAQAKYVCTTDCDESTESFSEEKSDKKDTSYQKENTKEALTYLEKQKNKAGRKYYAPNEQGYPAKKRSIKKYKNLQSNLPDYYLDEDPPENPSFTKPWRVVGTTEQTRIYGLNAGTNAMARISQDILVSPGTPQPILAEIMTGQFKGARLLGEATLERDLHRVLVKFHHISHDGDQIKIAANTIDHSGKVGIAGEYIAEDKALIAGSFLSTFLSGFTDSSVERHRDATGNYVDEPTVTNQAKKGLTATLSKAADRMESRANTMPGYTVVKGPVIVQVVFEELKQ
jgi:hypothetical protein